MKLRPPNHGRRRLQSNWRTSPSKYSNLACREPEMLYESSVARSRVSENSAAVLLRGGMLSHHLKRDEQAE